MKSIISFESPAQRSFEHPAHRSSARLNVPISIITVLAGLGAVVAFWAPAYLKMLDHLGGGFSAQSEVLGWSLLVVGALGLGSVVYLAWQDTRDPAWRAAHDLPQRPRSNSAAH